MLCCVDEIKGISSLLARITTYIHRITLLNKSENPSRARWRVRFFFSVSSSNGQIDGDKQRIWWRWWWLWCVEPSLFVRGNSFINDDDGNENKILVNWLRQHSYVYECFSNIHRLPVCMNVSKSSCQCRLYASICVSGSFSWTGRGHEEP